MKSKPTLADAMQKTAEPKASNLPASRRGKKVLMVYLEPAISKRLKILAAVNETSVQALAEEALDLLFDQHEKGDLVR